MSLDSTGQLAILGGNKSLALIRLGNDMPLGQSKIRIIIEFIHANTVGRLNVGKLRPENF